MPSPNRLTRREFFVSLAAVAVAAAVPGPIGLPTPLRGFGAALLKPEGAVIEYDVGRALALVASGRTWEEHAEKILNDAFKIHRV